MDRKYILTAFLFGGAVLAAADFSGTVSASTGLQLNGHAVPVAGTKQWPVGSGDDLKSDASPVVLTMKDGSRMVLGKFSRAKLELGTVRLLTGTMQYDLAQRSTIQVAVKGEVLAARSGVASTAVSPVTPVVSSGNSPSALTPTTLALPPVSRRMP